MPAISTRLLRRIALPLATALLATLPACSTAPSPAVSASLPAATPTPSPSSTPLPTPSPTAAPTPTPLPAATVAQLVAVAEAVYPACAGSSACAAAGTKYTTCDSARPSLLGPRCPLTARLSSALQAAISGVTSAPDPLGGGQDPEWATESITADVTGTGGVAHVALGFGPGTTSERHDLLIVLDGGRLLVDDIYCTGSSPATTDAYAPGWLNRSTCSG